jgi:hypothetical protein
MLLNKSVLGYNNLIEKIKRKELQVHYSPGRLELVIIK